MRRPHSLAILLVIANATWAGLCGLAAVQFAGTALGIGLAQLLRDGMFVGGFAAAEWRARRVLTR